MTHIIKIKNLIKKYNNCNNNAVDNVSFDVTRGEFFAFLGSNGAGKSTTINIISTLLEPSSGQVIIDGKDIRYDSNEIKKNLGIVFQNSVLDESLSIKENIFQKASFYNLTKDQIKKRFETLLAKFSLEDFCNKQYGKLSGGQRRKCDIIRALISYPKILILDEPTTGLDPLSRIRLWETIKELREQENLTVFLTTHYMQEAEHADTIAIIDKGKIIAKNTPTILKCKYSSDEIILHVKNNNKAIIKKILIDRGKLFFEKNNKIFITINDGKNAIELLGSIKNYIEAFEVKKGNMDNVFLNCTGDL